MLVDLAEFMPPTNPWPPEMFKTEIIIPSHSRYLDQSYGHSESAINDMKFERQSTSCFKGKHG